MNSLQDHQKKLTIVIKTKRKKERNKQQNNKILSQKETRKLLRTTSFHDRNRKILTPKGLF